MKKKTVFNLEIGAQCVIALMINKHRDGAVAQFFADIF